MKETEKITGGDALLRSLIAEGVDTIFGYPGGAIMPVYDKLLDYSDQLRHILTRHEQGAAHAAQAYAMATGKPGVCFSTSGPGATNLITGIANAYLDSVPVIFITAQVASSLIGTDAFQETDILGASMPVTKWNCQVNSADQIAEAVAKAFYIANTGRKGPVLIDIAKDAQVNLTDYSYDKCTFIRSYNPTIPLKKQAIESAAVMINHAEKPMILAGHGVLLSGAEKELLYFAEKSGIPVAVTLLGLSCFPTDHRLYAGLLGMHGNLAPNKMTNEADLIIAVGMRFDDRVTSRVKTYAKNARIIHIEIDPADINKMVHVDLEINADAKEALKYLTALVDSKSYDSWIREFKLCDKIENETVISKAINPEAGDIRMGEVVSMVSKLTNGEAIVVTDVGQNQMVAARYYDYKIPNSLITSGGMGTMGFGLPAAIGAKVGQPDREVVLFAGDGGLQMTIQELGTILHYGIPVKIVLLNNGWLGMVRQWQEMFFNRRYSSTEMINPDFQLIAQAYSIAYRKVQKREELSEAVAEMVKCEGPFFLEVRVEKEENILPMVPAGATVSDVTLTFESNC